MTALTAHQDAGNLRDNHGEPPPALYDFGHDWPPKNLDPQRQG